MATHLRHDGSAFPEGFTVLTRLDEPDDATGIELGVLRLAAGTRHEVVAASETAWLLMEGEVRVAVAGHDVTVRRESLFDELPSCVHVSAGERVIFMCITAVELTTYRADNARKFAARVHRPEDVRDEPRGEGRVGNASLRFVRTIFDRDNADPNAELVLGEVVTLPGRWSSYPPHHHPQPEIYHYRFTLPQGYGHAELGETVLKVRHGDTVKIAAGLDHAQAAAPGYGMYYAWVIRHLADRPYTVPEFTEEHRWVMQPGAPYWWPKGVVPRDPDDDPT
jgi:5-deoxy-glucuronate isomerase